MSRRTGDSFAVKDDTRTIPNSKKKRFVKMYVLFREVVFFFALLFTAYATVINLNGRSKGGPPPVPFFHRGSLVDDHYQGEMQKLMKHVSGAGLSFVMFYAPWDADSQDARSSFEEAATFYFNQVYFAGVNCWEPGSECRAAFKDITSFPQLVAYNGPRKGIEYQGPYETNHMINFVHTLLNPLIRVNSAPEIWKLRYLHNAVVVGHVKFNGVFGGAPYQVLYETSLRFAGQNHEKNVVFSIFTHDKVNDLMEIPSTPQIILYLWNKKIVYSGEMKSEALYSWMSIELNKNLIVRNSDSLSFNIKSGAVMVFFTPSHPLSSVVPYYQMFRRLAIKFNACGNSTLLDDFSSQFLNSDEIHSHFEEELLREEKLLRDECKYFRRPRFESCWDMPPRPWKNLSCYDTCRSLARKLVYSDPFSSLEIDERSPSNLILRAKEEKCRLLDLAPIPSVPKRSRKMISVPTACQTNTTITFLSLDSSRYYHFAMGLGINLRKRKHNTAAALFTEEETLHLDTDEVNEETISTLLNAFVRGKKNRFLRWTKPRQTVELSDRSRFSITDLTTQTFKTLVLNETETIIVVYHSAYCSYCSAVSHVVLSVAFLLRPLPHLRFARVDGERNDLPWQYTVHMYPSVLIFPAHRKAESRIFPYSLALTTHSLSQFILENLPPEERVLAMVALCARWGSRPNSSKEGEKCLRNVQGSCLDLISEALREYRFSLIRLRQSISQRERKLLRSNLKKILLRLQYLKSTHLNLAHLSNVEDALSVLLKK